MTERIICPHCGKEFSKYGIKNHIDIIHLKLRNGNSWNKGLTKETDDRVLKNSIASGNALKGSRKGILRGPLSEEHKKALSESMKKAHAEGRAWNIGMSRWNNEPSYPEKFFMEVIENEFLDKEYEKEFPISIWSFDFAWPHLKKAIEIDGEQHERFEDYKERDQRKDKYATENGWQVLRISWKDFYRDTKFWIQKAKNFIGREAS